MTTKKVKKTALAEEHPADQENVLMSEQTLLNKLTMHLSEGQEKLNELAQISYGGELEDDMDLMLDSDLIQED